MYGELPSAQRQVGMHAPGLVALCPECPAVLQVHGDACGKDAVLHRHVRIDVHGDALLHRLNIVALRTLVFELPGPGLAVLAGRNDRASFSNPAFSYASDCFIPAFLYGMLAIKARCPLPLPSCSR